jgi:glycosyltransferase involved in cell wall biosynthesis
MPGMHVLHILNSAHGGSALSTFQLIDVLSARGISSSLICFNNANRELQQKISDRVGGRVLFIPLYWMNKRIRASLWKRPLIELKALWDTWGGYRYQHQITQFIRKHHITLIHTATLVTPEGGIASVRNNLPHVWHVRELIGEDKPFRFYRYAKWSEWVSRHCSVLVANSKATSECLSLYFDTGKIKHIPNAIDVNVFSVKAHEVCDRMVVAMIGSVTSKMKNHHFFLETALKLRHKPIEFRIYGTIPDQGDLYFMRLKYYIQHHHLDNVRFMDFVSNPAAIMRDIDILFHPADLESFGRIFVEAMAGGIPVIGVNQGGALEMVREAENGFLISSGDADAAASHILTLAHDPELRNRFGKHGRALVEAEYSMDVLSTRIVSLYESLNNTSAKSGS